MSTSYAREKIGSAVANLATGTGSIQERLCDAFMAMGVLSDKDFEGQELEEWQSIYARATTVVDAKEGSFNATLSRMSEGEAVKLAADIVDLDAILSRV